MTSNPPVKVVLTRGSVNRFDVVMVSHVRRGFGRPTRAQHGYVVKAELPNG